MKKIVLILIVGAGIAVAACTRLDSSEGVRPVNAGAGELAVRGYDPVAYFTDSRPVEGKPEFTHDWNGANWRFANAENLERFKASPERYAPQFGGYCSYAVSHGYTADGDPAAWKVVDGKLYLNYNAEVKRLWEREQEKFIRDGHKNWQEFLVKKPKHEG